MGNVYYRKRISNQKGFRLNLHGSRKGLSGSYSLYSKKKKGEPAVNWNSKTGVTLSIHGTGLRWQQSQKGKGKTGKTREQISSESKAKKAEHRRDVDSRKREREEKKAEKEEQKLLAQQEKLEAKIEQKIGSLASQALKAEDKLYNKAKKELDDRIDKFIDHADECDTHKKYWDLTEKIDETRIQLESEETTNSEYVISGVTQQFVKDNWGEIKSSLASMYELTNAKLSSKGKLSVNLGELTDYYNEQKNILREITIVLNNYYYQETCDFYINELIDEKNDLGSEVLADKIDERTAADVIKLVLTTNSLIGLGIKDGRSSSFLDQNEETHLIKINFLKNYFVHVIERIEAESKKNSINKNLFFENNYSLLKELIENNIDKFIEDESEYENINYVISLIAEALSKNEQENIQYYDDLISQLKTLQDSEYSSSFIELESIYEVIIFKMIYALEEIVDSIESHEKHDQHKVSVSIENFIEICGIINKCVPFVNFDSKDHNETKELIINAYADVRISVFQTYYKLHIEPLIDHIDTNNIQGLEKEILKIAMPFIKLKKVISEEYIIKLNNEREKNYKICNEFVDGFVDHLIDIYAARIEELTDEIENKEQIDLISLAPIIIDLNGDLELVIEQINSVLQKDFSKVSSDIDHYIEDYCIRVKSNIQNSKIIKDYSSDNIKKLEDSFIKLKLIEESYIVDDDKVSYCSSKKFLKKFVIAKKDKFSSLNHKKWLKIDGQSALSYIDNSTNKIFYKDNDILVNIKNINNLCEAAKKDLLSKENKKSSKTFHNIKVLNIYYAAIYNELLNLNYKRLTDKNKKFLSSFFSINAYFNKKRMKTYMNPVLRFLLITSYTLLTFVIFLIFLGSYA